MTPASILVVDDEPGMRRYLQALLETDSYAVETVAGGWQAVQRIQQGPVPDLVFLDMLMPDLDGIETLARLRQHRHELRVVILSCVNEPRTVAQAIRMGATDYLAKPFEKWELDAVLKNWLPARDGETEISPGEVEDLGGDLEFVAASPATRKLRELAAQIGNTDVPVLLLGESGTGKEVVARLVHHLSARKHQPFLKVNCAALPGELLESELFGYEAGAFTGATRSKPGKFEMCEGGTILLDEIGEMPPELQAKLLHVLQDRQFARLGGRSTIKVNVRILAATNIDIPRAIASKRLREDLYYRLNTFTFFCPPLRDRAEEIPVLLRHFTARFATHYGRVPQPLSATLVEACRRYSWPGNLRELENFVKRFVILGDELLALSELESKPGDSLPADAAEEEPAADGGLKSLVRGLKGKAEKDAIARALVQANGIRKEAARLLSISSKALLYKMRQYGLDAS